MSFSVPTTAHPKGFHVTRSGDGYLQITYQATGWKKSGATLVSVLCLLTCIIITWPASPHPFEDLIPDPFLVLCVIPFLWAGAFGFLGYTALDFWTVTRCTFYPDHLVFGRTLFRYGYRRDYPKAAIHVVRQVQDSGEDDFSPTWGLVIEGQVKGELPSDQPLDKSDWLGPVVAAWAGVAFEPSAQRS